MSKNKSPIDQVDKAIKKVYKNIIKTEGGRGGTGKTTFMMFLSDYLEEKGVPFEVIDCDKENSEKPGSFGRYFKNGKVHRFDVRDPKELDKVIETSMQSEAPIVLLDLGAGSGEDIVTWSRDLDKAAFEDFGVQLISVGVISGNQPGSTESVFEWATHLQDRAKYLTVFNKRDILPNNTAPLEEIFFKYFKSEEGKQFQEAFSPTHFVLEGIDKDYMRELADSGMRIRDVLESKEKIGVRHDLTSPIVRSRLRKIRENIFAKFEEISDLLIP